MHLIQWLIGGIVGGMIGGGGWVAIAYFTNQEFGWLAWPVGLLVGLGIHFGSSADTRGGFLRGAVAVVLALAAVMGAWNAKVYVMKKQIDKSSKPSLISSEAQPAGETETGIGEGDAEPTQLPPKQVEAFTTTPVGASKMTSPKIKDIDMLWMCLSAITAYLVGKGSGTDQPIAEDEEDSQPQAEESTAEE